MTKQATVFVATIYMKYSVVAVAYRKEAAEYEACKRAYKFLKDNGALTPETNTLKKIEDYFGVTVTEVPIGGANMEGDYWVG